MSTKLLVTAVGLTLSLCPFLAVADDTQSCNQTQNARCENFCKSHNGTKSCVIDITTKSGTCTCNDGTSRSR